MTYLTPIIFIVLLIINHIIYKNKSYSKKLYIISTITLVVNFIFIIALYYNNLHLGFSEGIVFGEINGIFASDEYKYFMESEHLFKYFKENGFSSYLNKSAEAFPFIVDNKPYGIYNFFVLLIALLKMLGISQLVDLVTFKLIFTLFNTFLIYKISRHYLSEKTSLISTIIFNINPTYILVNITLIRDNIILTLILSLIYLFLKKKFNIKSFALIFIIAISLFIFRAYTLLALIIAWIFISKRSTKIISAPEIIFILCFIFGVLCIDKINFNIPEVQYLSENYHNLYGTGIFGLIKFIITLVKEIFIRGLFSDSIPTQSLYVVLTIFGSIYYYILIPFLIYKSIVILKSKDTKSIYLLKFSTYFIACNATMLLLKDGYIPARLCLMWTLLMILLTILPNSSNKEVSTDLIS